MQAIHRRTQTLHRINVVVLCVSFFSDTIRSISQTNEKVSVIDTIVAETQIVHGEDRCVLLLGYISRKLEERQPWISSPFRNRECIQIRGLH